MVLKNTKKLNNHFQKQIDEKINAINDQYDQMNNPYIDGAKKALNLKLNHFSVQDKEWSE